MAIEKISLQMPEGWQLDCDSDVLMVLEFILKNVPGSKRLKVIDAVHELAGPIFRPLEQDRSFHEEKFRALSLSPHSP
jgi:hypothetical protein